MIEEIERPARAAAYQNNPNFEKWFGDSKVVDSDGKPLVVYHDTSNDFVVFKDDRTTFVAFDRKGARMAASGSGKTMELYARAENPANSMEAPVHFGYVLKTFKMHPESDSVYVEDEAGVSLALRSNTQLKSATSNNGDFDPKNPDITK
jgi:hypothetical protein